MPVDEDTKVPRKRPLSRNGIPWPCATLSFPPSSGRYISKLFSLCPICSAHRFVDADRGRCGAASEKQNCRAENADVQGELGVHETVPSQIVGSVSLLAVTRLSGSLPEVGG